MTKTLPANASPFLQRLRIAVLVEIGKGRISERYIKDPKWMTAGLIEGRQITVNPITDTVGTVIHECLHRLKGHWSERHIEHMTTAIMRRLTDAEIQEIYRAYNAVKTTNRKAKIVEVA